MSTTTTTTPTDAPATHMTAVTQFVEAGGVQARTPLVLLQHFRGNLDNWDAALTDALARGREAGSRPAPRTATIRARSLRATRSTTRSWRGASPITGPCSASPASGRRRSSSRATTTG